MRRISKDIKNKRKVAPKKARPTVTTRVVFGRSRSQRRIEGGTHGVRKHGASGSRDIAGLEPSEPVGDQPGKSELLQRPETVARAMALYPQTTATASAALQAWFLLALRNLQSWQGAWFRLLPR